LGIVELVGAGGAKQLRRLVLVEIRPDRQIGEAAKGLTLNTAVEILRLGSNRASSRV
jgi:hypothetical protein